MKLPKMETNICVSSYKSKMWGYSAQFIALTAIIGDFIASYYSCPSWIRLLYSTGVLLVILQLYHWDINPLGLTYKLKPDYTYWFRFIGIIAIIIIVWAVVALMILKSGSVPKDITIYTLNPERIGRRFLVACIYAPIIEEIIYRFLFCIVFLPYLKNYGTIIAGGALFAWLHFIYGNPHIDNFLAGYFLIWVFLRSGSLLLPFILHILGNVYVILVQLGAWYILNGKI